MILFMKRNVYNYILKRPPFTLKVTRVQLTKVERFFLIELLIIITDTIGPVTSSASAINQT